MKQRVWRGMSYEEHTMLVQEVAKVLGREYCEFEVELFGVSQYARHLPDNFMRIRCTAMIALRCGLMEYGYQ